MRIAVCRPQVPFVYGGAELVADQLVDELRARAHDVELDQRPLQVVSGYACPRPGVRLAPDRPRRRRRQADRARNRDEVPLLRHPPPQQGRLARAPVPAGLRLRSRRVRPVLRVACRSGDTARGRALRRRRARRGAADLHHLRATSPARLKRYSGFDAQVLPPPPQKLAYHTDGYGDFVLSVNRLDRAKRIDLLRRGGEGRRSDLRVIITGEGPDRAASRAARGRPRRPRRVHRARRRRAAERALRDAASPSTTRRWTRTTAWCPTRPSWRPSRS